MLWHRDDRLAHLHRLSDSLCAPESLLCWLACRSLGRGSLGLLRLRSPLLIAAFFCPTAEPAHRSKHLGDSLKEGCHSSQHMQESLYIDEGNPVLLQQDHQELQLLQNTLRIWTGQSHRHCMPCWAPSKKGTGAFRHRL